VTLAKEVAMNSNHSNMEPVGLHFDVTTAAAPVAATMTTGSDTAYVSATAIPIREAKTTNTTSPLSTAEQLAQLSQLHQQGALTDAEFTAAKAKVLGTGAATERAT